VSTPAGRLRRLLMVAYHFPPLAGSSGIQRTLRFVQHLPALGWQPIVLTTSRNAYERTSVDLESEIPPGTVVERAWALDASRHLSIAGRYPGWLARPDRWASWWLDGVRRGLALVRRFEPDAIWSTFPIPTAHAIAATLQARTGLPWIADFRDPMAQDDYPEDAVLRAAWWRLDRRIVESARHCVLTTPGAAQQYRQRYPEFAGRIGLIENGFDEESFAGAGPAAAEGPLQPGCITLLHSGIVYPSERDPTQLMAALRMLHERRVIRPGQLRIRFRAAVSEALLAELAARHGVADYVEICPPVGYRQALAEMLRADALLVLQGSNCNAQIPAKIYEYLRAGRPVLCLADERGDTADALRRAGVDAIAALEDAPAIAGLLERWLAPGASGLHTLPDAQRVAAASRRGRAAELAALLHAI